MRHHGRPLSVAVAALGCVVALAACGSSSPPASGGLTGHARFAEALAFVRCMRSHAVPKFPDPRVIGDHIQIQILGSSSQIDSQSPAFQSAQQSCEHLLPSGGRLSQQQVAQEKVELLSVSQCMRRHGISEFPDPTTSQPSNQAGFSTIMRRDGVFLAIPDAVDVRSPAFQHAATACNFGPLPG